MNYVDIIILVAVALFAYMGYLRGFIRDFIDLLVLLGAIVLATYTYISVGTWLASFTPLSSSLASTVAFFLVWFAVMFIYYVIMTFSYEYIPEGARQSSYNHWFGLIPGALRGAIFVWFTINLIFILAISGPIRTTLERSFLSSKLSAQNSTLVGFLDRTFGPAASEAASFLTVTPQSSESIALGYTVTDVTTDDDAAKQMLVLLNAERKVNGEKELVLDEPLSIVGENHGKDMFARGYFSHNTPEGKTPFDRMDEAKIPYLIAGENLALAPTIQQAFDGLMASPGHRANMLSNDFGKVGIGVIDGGVYGYMFTQEFTN